MIDAICHEIKLRKSEVDHDQVIQTIYFGGGTPTMLSVEELSAIIRSEEHTSELQSPVPISYAVFCLKKKKNKDKVQNRWNYTQEKTIVL